MKKSSRFSLWLVFIFVLAHFAKDITQDILRISSPLDMLGNINEDISFLPKILQDIFYYVFGGLSFIAEAFLLIAIPVVQSKNNPKLNRWIIASIVYLVVFLAICLLLDPKYRIVL